MHMLFTFFSAKTGQNVQKATHSYACGQVHQNVCSRTGEFTFLPTFASHLHQVRVTPEHSRRPCARIRKQSISENTVE